MQGLGIQNFPGNGILVNSSNNLIGGDRVGVDATGNPNVHNRPITSRPVVLGLPSTVTEIGV